MTKRTKATEPDDETVTTYGEGPYVDLRCGGLKAAALFYGWQLYDVGDIETLRLGHATNLTDAILFVAEGKIP